MCLPHYVRGDHHSQMVPTFLTFENDFSIPSTIISVELLLKPVRAASARVHRGRVLLARVRNEKLLRRLLPSASNDHLANQRHVLEQELARPKSGTYYVKHYCDKLLLKVVKKNSQSRFLSFLLRLNNLLALKWLGTVAPSTKG